MQYNNTSLLGILLIAVSPSLAPAASGPSAAWHFTGHTSATLEQVEDGFALTAPNNAHALLSRHWDFDGPVRISAEIQSPPSSSLAPSVFIYWSPGLWLRAGYLSANDVYHANGPGSYAIISAAGKQDVYRLTSTTSKDWTYNGDTGQLDPVPIESRGIYHAIALTDKKVFFQTSTDGVQWKTLKEMDRPAEMATPPAKAIIGKGYDDNASLVAPDLANSLADIGTTVNVQLRHLRVDAIRAEELQASDHNNENFQDTFGLRELAKPGDPTYESVASVWPPLQYTCDAIGIANHPEEVGVRPDGILKFMPNRAASGSAGKDERAWFRLGEDRHRYGGLTTVTRSLQDGWLPILTTGYRRGGLLYKQTIAGWSKGMSPDEPLNLPMRLVVKNESAVTTRTPVTFYSELQQKDLLEWNLEIPAGEERALYMQAEFSTNGSPATAKETSATDYQDKIAEITADWTARVERQGMQISIPEERVMNAWRAWLAWLYTDVDKVKGHFQYRDGGAGFYEEVFGFSAARAAVLADQLGRSEDARRWIEAMLSMGNQDGLHIINYGLPDQGTLMLAVCHNYQTTGDKEWLKKVAPQLIKMCEWTKKARATSKAETPTTSPVHGMIKLRPYCDHPQPAYFLVADMYLANGLREVARSLPEIGLNDDAAWIQAEADSYAHDLRQSIPRSVFEVDGTRYLPLFPETRELLQAAGWTARDYYSLLVNPLLEIGGTILPTDSELAHLIVNALENRGGLLMGVSRFWGGIDHAYTAGYWYHRLVHGEPEKALLGLYASMAYGMSRDTFSSVEVTFAQDGKNFPTLPHNYSNLEQLRLVYNLLILETSDTLNLGAGIARHWLKGGQHVEVKDAVTSWGKLSYRMETAPDENSITFTLTPPPSLPANGIDVTFRHPAAKTIKNAAVEGAEILSRTPENITLKPGSSPVKVRVTY